MLHPRPNKTDKSIEISSKRESQFESRHMYATTTCNFELNSETFTFRKTQNGQQT